MKYYLENENISLIFDSLGGSLTSIKNPYGLEYLWQGDKEYWSGQSPVLFPICGSIRDDKATTKDGKKLIIPRHGLVRKMEFQCEAQEWNRIVFSFQTNKDMFQQFPYKFKLFIEYKLVHDEIQVRYIIENFGDEDMPFQIGGHPGFNCPLQDFETFEDYYLEFSQVETCSIPRPITETGLINITDRTPFLNQQKQLSLHHNMFSKDAIILDEIQSRSIQLLSKKSHRGIELKFEDFPYLILWSTNNKGPFIALEPWIGLSTCNDESDIFEEKRNIQTCEKLRTKSYSYTIKIL